MVALTFDAGSDAGNASAILDELDDQGIPATFGITGDWARANPSLVARMAAEGHLLLNHTDDHRSFTGASTGEPPLTAAERRAELEGAAGAIAAAGGGAVAPWFRPPFGDSDAGVLRDVGAAGYRWSVMWTVDSLGWKGLPAAEVVDRCVDGAVPGAIYLFHVGSASTDADALPTIIARLRAAGYGFVRVDQLV